MGQFHLSPSQIIRKVYDIIRNSIRVVISDGDNIASVNDSGQLKVVLDGKVDDENSSSELLIGDAEFVGEGHLTLDYAMIFITVYSDVGSAVNGLHFGVSSDGITWRQGDAYTIPAGVEKTFSFQPNKKYYRVHYINGVDDQAIFDLQSILKKTNSKPSSHRIQDTISDDDDAELVKSVITARKSDGTFVNIAATDSENLKVSNEESGLSIAKGNVLGTTFIHKFGNAPSIDIADGEVTVWDGADTALNASPKYVYSTTANIDSISSSNNADTQEIQVQGLTLDYTLVTQTVILTGQAKVLLGTPLFRIFRMKNISNVDIAGVVYIYTNGAAITNGVPDVANTVRAIINNGNNQTLMSLYTIPAGKTGYARDWYVSTSGTKKTSSHIVKLIARPLDQVFQVKHVSSINDLGTSYLRHVYSEPEQLPEKTDMEIIVNTDVDAAGVSAGFDIVLVDN